MAAQTGIARSVVCFKKTRKIKDLRRNIEVKKSKDAHCRPNFSSFSPAQLLFLIYSAIYSEHLSMLLQKQQRYLGPTPHR